MLLYLAGEAFSGLFSALSQCIWIRIDFFCARPTLGLLESKQQTGLQAGSFRLLCAPAISLHGDCRFFRILPRKRSSSTTICRSVEGSLFRCANISIFVLFFSKGEALFHLTMWDYLLLLQQIEGRRDRAVLRHFRIIYSLDWTTCDIFIYSYFTWDNPTDWGTLRKNVEQYWNHTEMSQCEQMEGGHSILVQHLFFNDWLDLFPSLLSAALLFNPAFRRSAQLFQ